VIVASTTGIPVAKPGFSTPPWLRWAMPTRANVCGSEPLSAKPARANAQGGRRVPIIALAEASFARRSRSAGGFGTVGVPIYRVGGGELSSPKPERGRVWEPSQGSHNNRAVALMVEQRSPKPRVVGSSPACPARSRRRELSQGSSDRVGGVELCSPKPERWRVWEPSQGSHYKGA
jgi:hypothetical protein